MVLGITVIEMVDGMPPNTDIVCVEMLPLIDQRDPPTLKTPKLYSADLNDIISSCLQKDPNLRFSCMDLLTVRFYLPLHALYMLSTCPTSYTCPLHALFAPTPSSPFYSVLTIDSIRFWTRAQCLDGIASIR